MTTPLIVCFVILGIALLFEFFAYVLWLSDYAQEYRDVTEAFVWCGLALGVFDILFGFIFFCNVATMRSESALLMPTEIARSPYTVYVKYEDRQFSSTEARMVLASNNLFRVEKKVAFNSYNKPCGESYKLVVEDGGK